MQLVDFYFELRGGFVRRGEACTWYSQMNSALANSSGSFCLSHSACGTSGREGRERRLVKHEGGESTGGGE